LKTFAAILLMGILLFNLAGYRILNGLLQDRAGTQLQSRVDKRQYDRSQLILVKVPVTHLSYYNSSPEFERVDGEIEIGGVPCQYVERRIFNDSLEFLCLPNHAAQNIRASGDDYFKLVNDKQPDSKPGIQKSFVGDPYMLTEGFRFDEKSFAVVVVIRPLVVRIPTIAIAVDERPPVTFA
jgi:hypothetical protein